MTSLEMITRQAEEIGRLLNTFNEIALPLSDDGQVCINAIRDSAERILLMMQEYSLEAQKENVNDQDLKGYLVFDMRNPTNTILIARLC